MRCFPLTDVQHLFDYFRVLLLLLLHFKDERVIVDELQVSQNGTENEVIPLDILSEFSRSSSLLVVAHFSIELAHFVL